MQRKGQEDMCNSSLNPHVERKTNIFNGFSDYGTGSHCVSVVITTVFPACRHQSWCEKSSDSEHKTFILKKKNFYCPKIPTTSSLLPTAALADMFLTQS